MPERNPQPTTGNGDNDDSDDDNGDNSRDAAVHKAQ